MRNLRNPKFSLSNDEKCCAEKARVSVLVLRDDDDDDDDDEGEEGEVLGDGEEGEQAGRRSEADLHCSLEQVQGKEGRVQPGDHTDHLPGDQAGPPDVQVNGLRQLAENFSEDNCGHLRPHRLGDGGSEEEERLQETEKQESVHLGGNTVSGSHLTSHQ